MWKYFFDQYYQPSKITSQVSVLMIKHLVAMSFELSALSKRGPLILRREIFKLKIQKL